MMRKIEEIPKEELQDDATFIAAVASAMKKIEGGAAGHYRLSVRWKNKVLVQQLQGAQNRHCQM